MNLLKSLVLFLIGVTAFGQSGIALAITLPTGFSETLVTGGLNQPIAFDFAPDGRIFLTEKVGKVRIIKDGQLLPTPFVTLPVDSSSERGLLGVALDPQFSENGYVYVYYTRLMNSPIKNRVSRFTVSASNPDIADISTERILVDNIPGEHGWHNGGDLHFAPDGTLYISTGDAVNSANSQNLSSLGGKMLRINKDGTIPADNPYAHSTSSGQATALPQIWNRGLRNPFRFAIDPMDGKIFINDVGEGSWEEINWSSKAANYGWPTCEGFCNNPNFTNPYVALNHGISKSITGGAFYYGNNFPAHYTGTYFFSDYVYGYIKTLEPGTTTHKNFATQVPGPVHLGVGLDGALYYTSITQGKLFKITHGASTTPATTTPPVATSTPPTATSTPPTATSTPAQGSTITIFAAGQPGGGAYPNLELKINDQTVKTFTNIQGDPWNGTFQQLTYAHPSAVTASQIKLNYSNDYYGGSDQDRNVRVDKIVIDGTAYETEAPSTYSTGTWANDTGCNPGNKQSEWLHCGGYFAFSGSGTPTTPVENQAPQASITHPVASTTFKAGDTISYSGTGTDPEDGSLPQSNYTWSVVFHHDTHTHPFRDPVSGSTSGSFDIPQRGDTSDNIWYRIHLTVRDSQGKEHTTFRDVMPRKTQITVATQPAGLEVQLDGQPKTAPHTFTGVQGMIRNLNVLSPQTMNGKQYEFVSWSDSGAQNHDITTPSATTTYTATFREIAATSTPQTSLIKIFAAGTPADNVYPTLQLLIDNQVVKTFSDIRGNPFSRTFQELTYTHSTPVTASQIRLDYTNDYYDPGRNQDRNVAVDKIEISDVVFETEAPSTHSTGTWAPESGCNPGNKQSEWLHCVGSFRFGQ